MNSAAVLSALGIIVVAIGIYLSAKFAIRADRRSEEAERRQAITDATSPYIRENDALRADTIRLQARINQLEDERRQPR